MYLGRLRVERKIQLSVALIQSKFRFRQVPPVAAVSRREICHPRHNVMAAWIAISPTSQVVQRG